MDPTPTKPNTSPRSRWETIIVTTPVVLTVLGTLLAGVSQSEMTLAQYFRTLAAQSQSKAGDQWGFYQAKRIRGTTLDAFVDLLPVVVRPAPVGPSGLRAASLRLAERLERVEHRTAQFSKVLEKTRGELPPKEAPEIAALADHLGKTAAEYRGTTTKLLDRLEQERTQRQADLVQVNELVHATGIHAPTAPAATEEDEAIRQAVTALREGKTESDLAPIVRQIQPAALQQDIDRAEARSRDFQHSVVGADRALAAIGVLLRKPIQYAADVHNEVTLLSRAVDNIEEGGGKVAPALQQALSRLLQSDADLTASADELHQRFKAITGLFTARRYQREAEANQRTAYLYEVQVRVLSETAEHHRQRSRHFFYGMLFAQAGVTIASLALAARHQSLFWGLAGLAGLTALTFSVYVYVFV